MFQGAFDDEEILHVEGEVNPVRDLEIISEELRLKDVEYMTDLVTAQEKACARAPTKEQKAELVCIVCNYCWLVYLDLLSALFLLFSLVLSVFCVTGNHATHFGLFERWQAYPPWRVED